MKVGAAGTGATSQLFVTVTGITVAITPDGTTAYVTNSGDGTVTPITLATIDPPPKPEPGPGGPTAEPVAATPAFTG